MMVTLPDSSSESTIRDWPRFHLKLRNGLFDRERGRPIFNEPPDGVCGDIVVERRCWSNPPEADFFWFDFYFFLGIMRMLVVFTHTKTFNFFYAQIKNIWREKKRRGTQNKKKIN